jgi:hypothetical protein
MRRGKSVRKLPQPDELREMRAAGMKNATIAKLYGVTTPAVFKALNRNNLVPKWVPESLIPVYREICADEDEFAAARYVRAVKRERQS